MPTHHPITSLHPLSIPQYEVRALRAMVELALCLTTELIESRGAQSDRLKAAAASMQLRNVLAALNNRLAAEEPVRLPPRLFPSVSVDGLLALLASRSDLPAILRHCAAELARDAGRGDPSDARNLLSLTEYVRAARDISGDRTRDIAREVAESSEWCYLTPGRVRAAFALHEAAARIARRPS